MTVRTIKQGVPGKFPPARLFLEDLEEITSVLKELVLTAQLRYEPEAKMQFTFTCDGNECDDIQDVPKVAKRLRTFSIKLRRGPVSTSLECDPWLRSFWRSAGFTEQDTWAAFHKLVS